MPIPEPSLHRPSLLYTSRADGTLKPASKEQRQREMAAVIGVDMSTAAPQLTQGEIERMRQIVNQHDSKNKNGMQVMDPNNPPKEPYKFQKFPMVLYNHKKCEAAQEKSVGVKVGNVVTEQRVHVPAKYHTLTVNSEGELAQALKRGWSEKAPELALAGAAAVEEVEQAQ